MARELTILIRADGTQAKRELGDVERTIDKVGGASAKTEDALERAFGVKLRTLAAGAAAAFAAADLAGAMDKATQRASQLSDAMQITGARSADTFQRIVFAAEQGGSSLAGVVTAFTRLNDTIGTGSKSTRDTLAALGLSFDTIKQLAPEQQFVAIGNAIGGLKDPNEQVRILNDLMGRGGTHLLPAFKDGLLAVGASATVMSDETRQGLDQAGKNLDMLKARMDVLKAEALSPLASAFLALPDSVQVGIVGVANFIPSIEALALAILAAGGPKAALAAITGGISAFGAGALTFITGAGAALVTFFTTTIPAAFAAVVSFLGPQGLLIAAALAMYAAWKIWGDDITAIAKKVYEGVKAWLVDKFTAIVGWVKEKVGAITGFFADLYDKVVGNSYVPDLIDRIAEEFGQLQTVMVAPTEDATNKVGAAFDRLLGKVGITAGQINRVFQAAFEGGGGVGGAVQSLATSVVEKLTSFIPVIGPIVSQFAGAIVGGAKKLWGAITGGPSEAELAGREAAATFRTGIVDGLTASGVEEVLANVALGADRAWAEFAVGLKHRFLDARLTAEESLQWVDKLYRAEVEGGKAVGVVIGQITDRIRGGLVPAVAATGQAGVDAINAVAETAEQRLARLWQVALAGANANYSTGAGNGSPGIPGANNVRLIDFLAANPGDIHRWKDVLNLNEYGENITDPDILAERRNKLDNEARNFMKDNPDLFPGRARGGPVWAGRPYWVGEEGRELFVPKQAGTIVPHGQSGGGVTVTINTIKIGHVEDGRDFARQVNQALTGLLRQRGVRLATA